MARRRRGDVDTLNPWPGYVDALSTLLMVIIFVLLVFVLAQAFLSVALTGRDRALDRLNRQVAELTDMLSLERGRANELQASVAGLNRDVLAGNQAKAGLTRELSGLRTAEAQAETERDSLKTERDRLSARLADAALQSQSATARNAQLQTRIAETAGRTDQAGQEAAALAASLADRTRQLDQANANLVQTTKALDAAKVDVTKLNGRFAQSQSTLQATKADLGRSNVSLTAVQAQLDESRAQLDQTMAQLEQARTQMAQVQAELDRTVKADKATVDAKVADLAHLSDQVRSLSALRDELERQAQDAAVRATTAEQRRQAVAAQLTNETKLSDSARAQVALLTQQMEQFRAQLSQVAAALDASDKSGHDKDAQIANLGSKLNVALASKVEELQRYRSEFFGRLREVLAGRPGIQVVGDRFVFQSEVLFPAGSADLTATGQDQIRKIAVTLKAIAADIPKEVNWLLRVDGHADKQKLAGGAFASNWELSSQRAINVVKLLIDAGVPPDRLAATGFGEYQPLDNADTPQAYARNRRIELRLTDR